MPSPAGAWSASSSPATQSRRRCDASASSAAWRRRRPCSRTTRRRGSSRKREATADGGAAMPIALGSTIPQSHLSMVTDEFKLQHREHFPAAEEMREGFVDLQLAMHAAILLKDVTPLDVCLSIQSE